MLLVNKNLEVEDHDGEVIGVLRKTAVKWYFEPYTKQISDEEYVALKSIVDKWTEQLRKEL
ncbi:hypothetical protein NVP1121O_226 [Vibrio phage 1.121.O._10N.286.46.C4]|nr:hypothetical protein NVP1121O_226 [Vibrio phage 1.121.O._10N.286.46.C4]